MRTTTRRLGFLAAIVILFVGASRGDVRSQVTSRAEPHSVIQNRYSAINHLQNDSGLLQPPKMARLLGKQYLRDFAPLQTRAQLSRLNATDLRAVLQAAAEVNSYAPSRRFISDMQLDVRELGDRATDGDYLTLYTALIADRDLGAAERLRIAHRVLPQDSLPRLVDRRFSLNGPSDLVLANDGSVLTRETITLRGPRVIIVASPLCHFCQNAARAFDADPRFQTFLNNHALWIVPPDGWLKFRTLRKWNAAHPLERMKLIYSNADWPTLDAFSTPTFYFFRGQRLISEVYGWPPDGNKFAVLKGMRNIGLVPPTLSGT